MQRVNSYLHSKGQPPYLINLDPAVRTVPFDCNIDIRDSLNYKQVMSEYSLGPNGGILTSLNIFATKIDQVMSILEKRTNTSSEPTNAKPIQHILVDTPGQIEVFVWSASGSILLDSLASSFPTVIAYIIDTPRTSSTSTFMSNMLYACSILYKTRLPMILVFNKTDVKDADFAKEWMTDFEAFQAALKSEEEAGSKGGFGGGSSYMSSLLNSMSLMLEEFYRHLSVVAVSSMTGKGADEFLAAVGEKANEFERDYKTELEKRKEAKHREKDDRREQELGHLMKDMNVTKKANKSSLEVGVPSGRGKDLDTLSDLDENSDNELDQDTSDHERPDEDEEEDDGDSQASGPGASGGIRGIGPATRSEGKSTAGAASNNDQSFLRYLRNSQIQ